MPSLEYESFGRIIVESMAFSVPIIATKVGGMPELINHGKDGFLVEKNDDDALASQIIDLLKNPEMRKSVGAEGRHRQRPSRCFHDQQQRHFLHRWATPT